MELPVNFTTDCEEMILVFPDLMFPFVVLRSNLIDSSPESFSDEPKIIRNRNGKLFDITNLSPCPLKEGDSITVGKSGILSLVSIAARVLLDEKSLHSEREAAVLSHVAGVSKAWLELRNLGNDLTKEFDSLLQECAFGDLDCVPEICTRIAGLYKESGLVFANLAISHMVGIPMMSDSSFYQCLIEVLRARPRPTSWSWGLPTDIWPFAWQGLVASETISPTDCWIEGNRLDNISMLRCAAYAGGRNDYDLWATKLHSLSPAAAQLICDRFNHELTDAFSTVVPDCFYPGAVAVRDMESAIDYASKRISKRQDPVVARVTLRLMLSFLVEYILDASDIPLLFLSFDHVTEFVRSCIHGCVHSYEDAQMSHTLFSRVKIVTQDYLRKIIRIENLLNRSMHILERISRALTLKLPILLESDAE